MKKLFSLIFIIFSLMSPVEIAASVNVILTTQHGSSQGGKEEPDDPREKGRRTAPVPVLIEIDFESLSISGPEILDEVESYEIWDDCGVTCLCVTTDASSFVETLSMLEPQTGYLIVMRTPDKTLSGSICLSF